MHDLSGAKFLIKTAWTLNSIAFSVGDWMTFELT